MSDKFQNKYRIPSARLQNWDYGSNALYFVTICTKKRKYFFGDIENSKMILSAIGRNVEIEWLKTFEMRKDMNLEMGEYVVMPNHFHAIIIIGENEFNRKHNIDAVCGDGGGGGDGRGGRDAMHRVSTIDTVDTIDTIQPNKPNVKKPIDDDYKNKFGPQSKNLASIIRGFKSAVTTFARNNTIDFAWQPRFHDHIVRDNESFQRISEYIRNNPLNWRDDKFYNDIP